MTYSMNLNTPSYTCKTLVVSSAHIRFKTRELLEQAAEAEDSCLEELPLVISSLLTGWLIEVPHEAYVIEAVEGTAPELGRLLSIARDQGFHKLNVCGDGCVLPHQYNCPEFDWDAE